MAPYAAFKGGLEVLADQKTLFPNVIETLKAAENFWSDVRNRYEERRIDPSRPLTAPPRHASNRP